MLSIKFLKKSQWTHGSISSNSRAIGLQRLICFKYYIVLKWESRFNFKLNAAKITIISKNCSNKSCSELNFVQKSQWAHMSPPPEVELRCSKDWYVSNILLYLNRKIDSLSGWTLSKLPIISKNASNKSC